MTNEYPDEATFSQPHGVHLVGSVPLANAEEVFRTTTSILGEQLQRIPDGVEGTRQRIATAVRYVPTFGVATECGLGRRPPETIPDLLRIHSEVAAPVQA